MQLFRRQSPYRMIDRDQARQLVSGWQDSMVPEKQWAGVAASLAAIRSTGTRPADVQSVIDLIGQTNLHHPTLLEVGCSSGYFSEILANADLPCTYTGLDYSPAFITFAQHQYPDRTFVEGDATAVPLPDRSFDVVLSGSCLLHILDYAQAIREAARVARHFVLFHKTPVLHLTPTTYTTKIVYDVPMLEIQFNEAELVTHFRAAGLVVVGIGSYAQMALPGLVEPIIYTDYLCRVS